MPRVPCMLHGCASDFPSDPMLLNRGESMCQVSFTRPATDGTGLRISDRDMDTCSTTKTTVQTFLRSYVT